METVAVYFEEPVRTYGLQAQDGCVLFSLAVTAPQLGALAAGLADLDPPLAMLWCNALGQGDLTEMQICLPESQAPRLAQVAARAGVAALASSAASVINLQGPHFGDRWGLAKEALAGLEETGVAPLSLAGVTHTLQVTVEPSARAAALAGLGRRFVAPEGRRGG